MDFENLIVFATTYLIKYFENLLCALDKPHKMFKVIYRKEKINIIEEEFNSVLDPQLMIFSSLSFLLGTILLKIAQLENPDYSFVERGIVTLLCWFLIGTLSFCVARILGGEGDLSKTLTYAIQTLSALFVICSLLHLVWFVFVQTVPLAQTLPFDLTTETLNIYFSIQLILIFIYLTLGIGKLHCFGWFRSAIHAAITSIIFVCFNIALLMSTRFGPIV